MGLEVLTRLERCAEPPGGAGTRNLDIGVFSHVRDRCAGSLQVHKNLIECYVSESNMSFRSQSPAGMRKGAICELHVDQFYDCRITRPVVPCRHKTRLCSTTHRDLAEGTSRSLARALAAMFVEGLCACNKSREKNRDVSLWFLFAHRAPVAPGVCACKQCGC